METAWTSRCGSRRAFPGADPSGGRLEETRGTRKTTGIAVAGMKYCAQAPSIQIIPTLGLKSENITYFGLFECLGLAQQQLHRR